jgi:plastocyanin
MSSKSGRGKKILPLAGVLALAVLAGGILASQSLAASAQNQQSESDGSPAWFFKLNKRYNEYEDGTLKVKTGAGGAVGPLTWYFPKNAEIKVGETVVWYNPTSVGEPHTVTFIKDPADFPALDVPYVISNSSALLKLDPNANSDPTLIPGPEGKTVAVIANARAYSSVAVTDGKAQYLPPNANYTMTGDESYVNSALIWPEGQAPPGLPEITSFSVKFEKEGTYDYLCILHPWMAGRVVVK